MPPRPATTCAVSVIVPCYNHGEFVQAAVDSVLALRRDDVELIVVDDGSTDERTRQAMDKLAAQGVWVIRQANQGLAAARNAAIRRAHGRYLLPLDADNRMRAPYLEQGVKILDENPHIGVVYGDAEYCGARAGRWEVGAFDLEKLLKWNYIDACAIYRRTIWEQMNGYDGTMPVMGCEDWDLWLSSAERGWQFAYLREICFDYRVAEGSMSARTAEAMDKIEKFIAAKHSLLYRRAWQEKVSQYDALKRDWDILKQDRDTLYRQRDSFKAIFRNFRRWVKNRILLR